MTRVGKIARLPKDVRDELNRRLDNGEQGRRLLVWLNGLAEVKEMLERDFGGHAIMHCNLTEWKQGGYLDWRSQQEALDLTKEFIASGGEFAKVSGEAVQAVEAVTVAHYVATLQCSNRDPKEDPRERLERLRKSLADVVRLRRCEQAWKRMEIEREWLELERQKCQIAKTPGQTEQPEDSNEILPMTEEQKTEMLKKLLLPEDEGK